MSPITTATKTVLDMIMTFDKVVMAEVGVDKGSLIRGVLNSEIAHKIEKYWAIDIWSEKAATQGTKEEQESVFYLKEWKMRKPEAWDKMYFRICRFQLYYDKLSVARMPSMMAVEMFPDEYFDIVYIDAMHLYKYVKEDILHWKPKVKKGGILCGHDYGSNLHPQVSVAVHDVLGDKVAVLGQTVWMHKVE